MALMVVINAIDAYQRWHLFYIKMNTTLRFLML